jgi:hypothetical protein
VVAGIGKVLDLEEDDITEWSDFDHDENKTFVLVI